MVCYHPLEGWRSRSDNRIVFNRQQGWIDRPVTVACGQCIGCRLERSRQWALRCQHEASLHERNIFLTLTYNDENLPADGSLDVTHWQKFMKRLRKQTGAKVRFYHSGEYGTKYGRPHYHACLFGLDFEDKRYHKITRNGHTLYTSPTLDSLWPFGFANFGSVTFESAAYVARYCVDKITGEAAEQRYRWVDEDGVIHQLKPEYSTMSRRPGIAAEWFQRYKGDVYPHGYLLENGRKLRPPRYYDGLFEIEAPGDMRLLKAARRRATKNHADNNTPERRKTREYIQGLRLKQLKRNHE